MAICRSLALRGRQIEDDDDGNAASELGCACHLFTAERLIPIAAADRRVGTVADTHRVHRKETGVFDVKPAVAISAARNEWESFERMDYTSCP